MNNISEQLCCGCGGCVEICPAGCIELRQDAQGFFKTYVEENACLQCGMCLKKCSLAAATGSEKPITAYAAYHQDADIRESSSSGGVFSALACAVLKMGGTVYGAAFDDEMHLRHVAVEEEGELGQLRGSKYLQSDMTGVFANVKTRLQMGKTVLFTGTPCQIAGLYTAVGRPENLMTCDLICHGAPSAGLFQGYLQFLEKKYGRITAWNFRSKENANARMSYTVKFKAGGTDHFISGDEEPYTMRFISGALQAESCYQCPYTTVNRQGDITLGDYWGYEDAHPQLKDIRGVSLVLVNSPTGKGLLEAAEGLELVTTEEEKYLVKNHHLLEPAKKHPQREALYRAFGEQGFTSRFYEKYFLPDGFHSYILKRRVKSLLNAAKHRG